MKLIDFRKQMNLSYKIRHDKIIIYHDIFLPPKTNKTKYLMRCFTLAHKIGLIRQTLPKKKFLTPKTKLK